MEVFNTRIKEGNEFGRTILRDAELIDVSVLKHIGYNKSILCLLVESNHNADIVKQKCFIIVSCQKSFAIFKVKDRILVFDLRALLGFQEFIQYDELVFLFTDNGMQYINSFVFGIEEDIKRNLALTIYTIKNLVARDVVD